MNEREIRRLVRIVEESGIGELEIRRWWGAKRIRISKCAGTAPGPVTVNHSSAPVAVAAPPLANPAPAAAEPAIADRLTKQELAECFNYEKHLRRVEVAYQRLGI